MGGPWVYEALCFSKRNLAQLEHLHLQRIQLLLKSFNNLISGFACSTFSRGRSGGRRSGQACSEPPSSSFVFELDDDFSSPSTF